MESRYRMKLKTNSIILGSGERGSASAAVLGWLTIAGLVVIVLALVAQSVEFAAPYPVPFTLLCVGAACFLIAGIPWAHTRGMRGWKIAFLAVIGFAVGGAAGGFLGILLDPGGPNNLGVTILLMIGGFWLGALLVGCLGIWWGIKFHRRLESQSSTEQKD